MKQDLNKPKRYNEPFSNLSAKKASKFGFSQYFGLKAKDFYKQCLNEVKEQIITESESKDNFSKISGQ